MDARVEMILRQVRAVLPGVQALYLYGSTVQGGERTDSDVDLGLLLPPEGDRAALASLLTRLGTELAMELEQAVDLVDLRRSSTVLCQEVVATGRRIYTGDARAADEFEMLTLSLYQKLNDERREILEQFWATGRAVAP